MSTDTRLRELLNEIAPPPDLAESRVVAARTALHAAYRDVAQPAPRVRRRPSLAWATATAVVAAVVAVALLLPGSSPSVDASLADIARAARELDAEQLPAGSFVYSILESTSLMTSQIEEDAPPIHYLLSMTEQSWMQLATEQRITTVGTPVFFEAGAEEAYYAGGLHLQDEVGETRTDRFGDVANLLDITKWSDDPAALREQLAAELANDVDPVLGEDIRLLLVVEELMDPSLNAPPRLRAALIEIVGSRDFATAEMADGSVLVSVAYQDPGLGGLRQELEFDGVGYLRGSRSILLEPDPAFPVPRDTVISQSIWSRPYVVDGPGVLPEGR